ncbi:MAG: pilus assembly protein PilY, partial [Gammaproteobacteria bacterium]|nr:pilus assembly protein PilY [Gammaproteobacteria bacterium]
TPSTGELYYQGGWHTWLVGGLGPGGAALFALDVTDPTTFSESNAARMTIGEWTPANINCANASGCGANLGQTYGTPLIRRLHNGKWAVLFGNGFGSSTGDAGIYIMTVDPASGANTFYYLSTGSSSANGIASVASADLDGDHVTDYVYAGDLNGNLWRFDLTSNDPLQWSVTPGPLFTAPSGQPITTRPVVASIPAAGGAPRLMIAFGTGRKQPLTNTSPTSYAGGTQDLYGVWDWNLSTWNSQSLVPYASLPATAAGTGLAAPYTIGKSKLQAQVLTINGVTTVREGTSNAVCWQGSSACASGNSQFGWYADLPGGGEQIIYNPILYQGAFIVNSIVPASNSLISCAIAADTGYTYAITVGSGSTFAKAFPKYNDLLAAGVPENATGTPSIVTTAEGTAALVYQTIGGKPAAQLINLPSNIKAKRLTWVELR